VSLRRIVRGEQLTMGLDPGSFWALRSINELAAEQGINPVEDIGMLRDPDVSGEEIDRLLAALDEM
jgi:hypothetical protein